MNTGGISREEILTASRELIRREGWAVVNIRSVAAACGVSVGSIYSYFDSKVALAGDGGWRRPGSTLRPAWPPS